MECDGAVSRRARTVAVSGTRPDVARGCDRDVRYWADHGATSFKMYMNVTRGRDGPPCSPRRIGGGSRRPVICARDVSRSGGRWASTTWNTGWWCPPISCATSSPTLCPKPRSSPRRSPRSNVAGDSATGAHSLISSPGTWPSPRRWPSSRRSRPHRPPIYPRALDAMTADSRASYLPGARPHRRGYVDLVDGVAAQGDAVERAFRAAGGLLLAGSDPTGYGGVVPGYSNQRQIELLVESGFTPVEAIHIATLRRCPVSASRRSRRVDRQGQAAPDLLIRARRSGTARIAESRTRSWSSRTASGTTRSGCSTRRGGTVGLH